jgi:hypothetical protein
MTPESRIYRAMRTLTTHQTLAKMHDSVWGKIERVDTKHRLKLCRQVGLYTPVDPKEYTRARVAALLAQAAVVRFVSSINI